MNRQEAAIIARAARAARFPPLEERFWSRVDKGAPTECWPWKAHRFPPGYGCSPFSLEGTRYANRIALILSGVEVPANALVLHSCDRPPCCNPAHLRVGTQVDNMADRITRGHVRRGPVPGLQGERHPQAKLKANDVVEIRRLLAQGMLQRVIATRFGVNQTMISSISRRKNWAHV